MAEVTLEEIRNVVRFRGDYTSTRKFPDADVNKEIQRSFAEFYELIDSVNEGWWDTQGTVTTTAGVAYVALPDGTWRVHGIDRLDSGEYEPMEQIGRGARHRFSSTTGKPSSYRLTSRGIELLPPPDAVYTLRVLYTPIAPTLVEAQPREWYNGWEDYVVLSTLVKLDTRENKPLTDRVNALGVVEARIRAGASLRKQQEPEYLNLREMSGSSDPWHESDY